MLHPYVKDLNSTLQFATRASRESETFRVVSVVDPQRGDQGSMRITGDGAYAEIRTRDLFLTKEVLCHLSYVGLSCQGLGTARPRVGILPLSLIPA